MKTICGGLFALEYCGDVVGGVNPAESWVFCVVEELVLLLAAVCVWF